MRAALKSLILLPLLLAGRLCAQSSIEEKLPFTTSGTATPTTVKIRQKVQWNRKTGKIQWKQFEAELREDSQGVIKVVLDPGSYLPKSKKDQKIGLRLEVPGGNLKADYQPRGDATYRADLDMRFDPRPVRWKDPDIQFEGLSLEGQIVIDSRLDEGPLSPLAKLDLKRFAVKSIHAGLYHLTNIKGSGQWNRPNWTLANLEGDVFGGRLALSGQGEWGTQRAPRWSVDLNASRVDLRKLLESFNTPRAQEIQALVSGTGRVEVDGRNWKLMNLDVRGEERTVFLHRQLLYDVLSNASGKELTEAKIKEVLDHTFGNARMIPFEQMEVSGGLTPGSLNMNLPLRNAALDLRIEPRVEREVLWDIWDSLVQEGLNNLKKLNLKDSKVERQ